MPSFTKSITIDRSPEQVFAVLDDLDAAKRWMPSIRRIDVLTPGMAMGVGYKWRETRRVMGILRMKVVLTIVAYERPTTWGLMFNDGKVRAGATFELGRKGTGTQVTFTEEVEDLQGKPARADRMLKMMEKQDRDLLERLKGHVEGTTEGGHSRAEASEDEAPAAPAAKAAKPKAKGAPKKAPAKKAAKAKPAAKKAK